MENEKIIKEIENKQTNKQTNTTQTNKNTNELLRLSVCFLCQIRSVYKPKKHRMNLSGS